MKRYFIYLSYNGKNYCGWQRQPNGITIQEELENAVGKLAGQHISITGAGRTDSGVHALCMIAHMDFPCEYSEREIIKQKLNRILPADISIQHLLPVQPDAHARFDAISRTYKYYISWKKDPFRKEFLYRLSNAPDVDKMNLACKSLFDYTDFTSFSKLHTDVKTNNCKIMHARWEMENDTAIFTICADRFLRNMVRAIVGTLLEVGKNKLTLNEFRNVIEEKNRNKAGMSVPAHALFLTEVLYPESIFITD